jgi:ketosteroid isomerase-like protein
LNPFEALLRRWQTAVRDRDLAALEELLAPEFELWTGRPAAPTRTRAEYLDITATRYVIEDFAFEAIAVVELGADAALVRSRYRQTGSMDGARRDEAFLLTDVFARRDGRWVAVHRHSSGLGSGS